MNLLLYGLVALAVIGAAAGFYGKIHHDGYVEGKGEVQQAWDKANQDARKHEAEMSAKAAADLAAERANKKVVIQTRTVYVDKIVDRPVYRNQCFDNDGLRCLNAAINGTDAAGCKPDGTVPAVKPSS